MTHKSDCNSLDSLLKIMQALRAPDGCPWDAAQTPESLTPYILEEACELIEAIEEGSPKHVLDELGDLLLQVVFQAQIFNERKQFDFHDVVAGISEKLVRRHPHVFERENMAGDTLELDRQWEAIKRSESNYNKVCLADHLPDKLPALQRAQKLVAKVRRADRHSELPGADEALLKIFQVTEDGTAGQLDEMILGQALFHLVKLAHLANLDAEAALRKLTRKTMCQLESE